MGDSLVTPRTRWTRTGGSRAGDAVGVATWRTWLFDAASVEGGKGREALVERQAADHAQLPARLDPETGP